MGDTLTIFKNYDNKIYCISKDLTAFSISKCQSITVSSCLINYETERSETNGFKEVSCNEFYNKVYK